MSVPILPLDSAAVLTQDNSVPAIVFEDVALAFAENDVLRGVSFSLAGERPRRCSAWRARARA